jgi:hypothetical protein
MRKVSRNHLRRAHRALRLGFMLVVVLLSQGGPSTAEAVSTLDLLRPLGRESGDVFFYNIVHPIDLGSGVTITNAQLMLRDSRENAFAANQPMDHLLFQMSDTNNIFPGVDAYDKHLLSITATDQGGSSTYVGDISVLTFFGLPTNVPGACSTFECGFSFSGKFMQEVIGSGGDILHLPQGSDFSGKFVASDYGLSGHALFPSSNAVWVYDTKNISDTAPLQVVSSGSEFFFGPGSGGALGTTESAIGVGLDLVRGPVSAPGPSTVFLIGSGLLGLLAWRRKQVKANSARSLTA